MLQFKLTSQDRFYRNLLTLTLGSAAATIPCYAVAFLLGGLPLAGVAGGIAGALTMFWTFRFVNQQVKTLPGVTAAILSGIALGLLFPAHPILGCISFGGLFGLSQATAYQKWSQKLSLVASGSAAALFGGVVCGALPHLAFAAAVPTPLWITGTFGMFGFYMGLGCLPAHVRVRRDLVGARYAKISAGLRPEIRDYVSRVFALHTRFTKILGPDSGIPEDQEESFSNDLEAMVLKILSLAVRWQEIEIHLTGAKMDDLGERIRLIEEKMATGTDTQVLAQYAKTKEALLARARDLGDIGRARDRIVSGLTYSFTKLEGLYYTLVKMRCTDPQSVAGEIEQLLRSAGQLTEETDAAGRTLDEITAEAGIAAPPENLQSTPPVRSGDVVSSPAAPKMESDTPTQQV